MEKVATKVEERARDRLTADYEMPLVKMPPTRATTTLSETAQLDQRSKNGIPNNECGQRAILSELIVLPIELEVNPTANRVVQIDLPVNHVVPSRRVRICDAVPL